MPMSGQEDGPVYSSSVSRRAAACWLALDLLGPHRIQKSSRWIEVSDEPVLAGRSREGLAVLDWLKDSLEVNPELRINELVEVLAILDDDEVLPAARKARPEIEQAWEP